MASRVGGRGVNHPPLPRLNFAKVPAHHAHGCIRCGWRYEDNCADANKVLDGVCSSCMTVERSNERRRSLADENKRPRACCRTSSSCVVSSDTLVQYKLGGARTWYICGECFRTHPFDPSKETT